MKLYDFHGSVSLNEIGKELRSIAKQSSNNFKILTGYGSTNGVCKSKIAAIKSLRNMRREGLIKDFLPAEKNTSILMFNDEFYRAKMNNKSVLTSDRDAIIGNDGIIFVFVK